MEAFNAKFAKSPRNSKNAHRPLTQHYNIEYRGVILPYKTFDKIREVNRAEIVENKRLGPALEIAAKMQAEREVKRSQRTPRRRGQGKHMFSTPEHASSSQ